MALEAGMRRVRQTLRSLHVRQQFDNKAVDVRRRLTGACGSVGEDVPGEFCGSAWRCALSTVGGGLKGS